MIRPSACQRSEPFAHSSSVQLLLQIGIMAAGFGGGARGACGTQARAPAGRRQAASWSILRSLSFLCSARWAMLR